MSVMPALLRRYRWWLALIAALALIVLARQVYTATLPASAWVDRGWYATRDAQYVYAERCFQRAAARDPESPMPRLGRYAALEREVGGKPHAWRFGALAHLPVLGPYLRKVDRAWRAARIARGRQRLAAEQRWYVQQYGTRDAGALFTMYWPVYPRQVRAALAAARQAMAGDYAGAWEGFHALARKDGKVFDGIMQVAPELHRYYREVAWRTGHADVARRLERARFGSTPVELWGEQERYCGHNMRLAAAAPQAPARTWAVDHGLLLAGREATDTTPFLLIPSRRTPYLLYASPAMPGTGEPELRWWQWRDGNWTERSSEDELRLLHLLMPTAEGDSPTPAVAPEAHTAWLPPAEYLSLRGTFFGRTSTLLLRIDDGVSPVGTFAPHDLAALNGDLWMREHISVRRIAADGAVTDFCGQMVTRSSQTPDPFVAPEQLSTSAMDIDPSWILATDKRGRLWLASWDGFAVDLHAAWRNGGFVPPATAEQAQAKAGIIDAAGRLHFPADLPAGFQRDGWRHVPGLAKLMKPATYAVDGQGRVWAICRGVAARWQQGKWVSVADRLPDLNAPFTAIIAAGNGVLIAQPGLVSYVE